MTSPAVTFRLSRGRLLPTATATPEQRILRTVRTAWALLLLNALTYTGSLLHIPTAVGKGITQGALQLALVLALSVNRKVAVRPNMFLCVTSLLIFDAILTAMQPQHLGTVYRTFRLAEFIVTLWLLTPWWGRRDLLLVRQHIACLAVTLGTVILGLLIAPGLALPQGRLSGILWDIPATQVAHYAAIVFGLVVVLWFCGEVSGGITLVVVVTTTAMLVLTHTRTALIGMIVAIVVAGFSLILGNPRVRRVFAVAGIMSAIAVTAFFHSILSWLARGQGSQELTQLTGRTKVWGPLLALPRDKFQEIFGFGLSNSSFNGLPIDSNWLSSYLEQGLFGVTVCALMLICLFLVAYFQPRSMQRAVALFLITYCLMASFTEDGFTDATPYLLELALAASLLIPVRGGDLPP